MASFFGNDLPKVYLQQVTTDLIEIHPMDFSIEYEMAQFPKISLTGYADFSIIKQEKQTQTKGDFETMSDTSRSPQYTKKMLVGSQDELNPSIDYWTVTRLPEVNKKVLITVTRVIEFMYAVVYVPTEKGMWRLAGMGISKCNLVDSFSPREGIRLALYRMLASADMNNKVDNAHRTAFIHKLLEEWDVPVEDEILDF